MKRSKSRIKDVGICPVIQQEQRERHLASHRRDEQRRAAGEVCACARAGPATDNCAAAARAGPPWRGSTCFLLPAAALRGPLSSAIFPVGLRFDVHVDAGIQERARRLHVTDARGKVQRGKS